MKPIDKQGQQDSHAESSTPTLPRHGCACVCSGVTGRENPGPVPEIHRDSFPSCLPNSGWPGPSAKLASPPAPSTQHRCGRKRGTTKAGRCNGPACGTRPLSWICHPPPGPHPFPLHQWALQEGEAQGTNYFLRSCRAMLGLT